MTLRITKLNVSGFSATQAEAIDQTYVNSAYEFVDNFSIDLKFEGQYEDDTDPLNPVFTYQNATNVTSTFNWSQYGITFSKPNVYTVRLVGPGINVFVNQYYRFVLPDYSQQVLDANTSEPFLSLVKYQMPSPTYVMKTYPFSVTIPADPILGGGPITQTINMNQWFYWSVAVAEANIARLKTQGLR
jgi:hypothetical protein